MKAFLLAAGIGSHAADHRHRPKCMVPIDGRPLLDIWLDAFGQAGIDEVLINLHYLPDIVRQHAEHRAGGPAIRLVFEPELLGSAGTLLANREWVAEEEFFLACNADNLTDFDLRSLVDVHRGGGEARTQLTCLPLGEPVGPRRGRRQFQREDGQVCREACRAGVRPGQRGHLRLQPAGSGRP